MLRLQQLQLNAIVGQHKALILIKFLRSSNPKTNSLYGQSLFSGSKPCGPAGPSCTTNEVQAIKSDKSKWQTSIFRPSSMVLGLIAMKWK